MKKSKILSLVLTFAMLASMVTVPAMAANEAPAASGHWSDAAMSRWAGVKVFKGDQYGNFMAEKEMTRAEFAQVLVNLMGYTEKAENTFADIPEDEWYADAMLKLVAAGVIQGTGYNEVGPIASPTAPISREQAAVLLCRALSLKPSGESTLNTEGVSEWAKDAMTALTERGMMKGDQYGNLMPGVTIDRGSVAQMMSNMVSDYVTTDGAVITGEHSGLVIVVADNVRFENAKLNEAVVVAPKAGKATVTLTDGTTASDVTVASEGANVVVGKTAAVENITLVAVRSKATVNGTVTVIVLAETADNAAVTANAGAKVDSVTVASAGASVSGARNTIGTIVAESTASNVNIHASGAQLVNKTDKKIGSVAAGETGKAPGSVDSSVISSSSPSYSGTYTITKDTCVNGRFVTKVNGIETTSANAGDVVTVVATPNEGYELDAIAVYPADEVGAPGIAVTNGQFTMPAKAVIVSVTFKAIPETPEEPEGTYTIKADAYVYSISDDTYVIDPDVKVYVLVDDVEVVELKAAAGATVEVVIKDAVYDMDAVYVDGVSKSSTFTMPAKNVVVRVNVKKKTSST